MASSFAYGDCVEVLGGNRPVDQGLSLFGLDLWLFSRPQGGEEEGGDLVFVSSCTHAEVVKIYLGDVAGHGRVVAPVARDLEAMVREQHGDLDPAAFFRSLNRETHSDVFAGLFATMAALGFDRPGSRLLSAYAGHPRLLLKRASEDGFSVADPGYCPVPGAATDIPLGIVSGTEYYESAVPFLAGDVAVVYSDALIEAEGGDGVRPGLDGLLELAGECSTASAEGFRRDLLRLYRDRLGVEEFDDDVSLAVIRRE